MESLTDWEVEEEVFFGRCWEKKDEDRGFVGSRHREKRDEKKRR